VSTAELLHAGHHYQVPGIKVLRVMSIRRIFMAAAGTAHEKAARGSDSWGDLILANFVQNIGHEENTTWFAAPGREFCFCAAIDWRENWAAAGAPGCSCAATRPRTRLFLGRRILVPGGETLSLA
jgi:hypothetical protein